MGSENVSGSPTDGRRLRQTDGRRLRQPTVKEVAVLAGVSPMTVSRTMGGGVNVRPELRDRVLEAARTLGYHRNEVARRMRAGQGSGLVGIGITNLANPYYAGVALGVEDVVAQHGLRILMGSTGEDLTREQQLVADFLSRQVEGLILVPSGDVTDHLQDVVAGGIPLVLASRAVPGLAVDQVLLDDVGGAREGTRALLAAGHRRIAYLGNAASVSTGNRRFEGFVRALAEAGLEPDPLLVKRGQQEVEAAREAMGGLLELADPPTAVFCANNRNSVGALGAIGEWLRRHGAGAPVPALLAFDDFELAELMPCPVTVIDHDPRELGRAAGRLLVERWQGEGHAQAQVVEIPTRVVVARP